MCDTQKRLRQDQTNAVYMCVCVCAQSYFFLSLPCISSCPFWWNLSASEYPLERTPSPQSVFLWLQEKKEHFWTPQVISNKMKTWLFNTYRQSTNLGEAHSFFYFPNIWTYFWIWKWTVPEGNPWKHVHLSYLY